MSEIFADAKSIILSLFGALVGLMLWLGRREVRRIDDLEKQSVTRDELSKTLNQMRDDRLQMHRENREELRYIRERVDGIADRQ